MLRRRNAGSVFLAVVLVLNVFLGGFAVYADEAADGSGHIHNEGCYAVEGDLLCSLSESEGHVHGEECYCPGGEYICGLEETEEHSHNDECLCPGGELICETEESEGHAHGEDCFAKGGELICSEDGGELLSDGSPTGNDGSDGEMNGDDTDDADNDADDESENSDYDYIKDMLINNEDVDFNPETQTFIVIHAQHEQSEHLKSLGLSGVDDIISGHEEYKIDFGVLVNGEGLKDKQQYYIISSADKTMEIKETHKYVWSTSDPSIGLSPDEDEAAVMIINKNDEYNVYYELNNNNYYYLRECTYNGAGYVCRQTNKQYRTEFKGTAGDNIVEAEFSFEWDLCNWLDIEIFSAKEDIKEIDNPGFIDIDGYINFKIELRDADGNISLLPREFYNNYGSDDEFIYMKQDGIVEVSLEPYDDDKLPHSTPYGEFDVYLPFGFDYRITLLDYSVDTLGGYAYVMNQEHRYDADGFALTDLSAEMSDSCNDEWGSFIEYTFMPLNKEIKVEKKVEGNAPENSKYTFNAEQNVYAFSEANEDDYWYYPENDLAQGLIGYPYDLYDSATGEKLNSHTLKTDMEGCFDLKADQYALFKVWELPEDFIEYEASGFTFYDVYEHDISSVGTESKYIVKELGASDCDTKVTHTRGDKSNIIEGKTVNNILGGDAVLFKNIYTGSSKPSGSSSSSSSIRTGKLMVSNKVSGDYGNNEKEFTFTITLDDESINGLYGDMVFLNGKTVFVLKNGEEKTASGLPAGISYTIIEEEADKDGYVTTVTGESGKIESNKTSTGIFVNIKDSENINDSSEENTGDRSDDNADNSDSLNGIGGVGSGQGGSDNSNQVQQGTQSNGSSDISNTTEINAAEDMDEVPRTGDDINLFIWTALLAVSLAGIVILIWLKKKNSCKMHR